MKRKIILAFLLLTALIGNSGGAEATGRDPIILDQITDEIADEVASEEIGVATTDNLIITNKLLNDFYYSIYNSPNPDENIAGIVAAGGTETMPLTIFFNIFFRLHYGSFLDRRASYRQNILNKH